MDVPANDQSFIVLVDDCDHSAHLLMRTLASKRGPTVVRFEQADEAERALASALSSTSHDWPGLVIVDLKSHSGANLDFIERNQALLRQSGVPLVAMVQPADRARRQRLHEAGAAAVFFRQADRDAYRHEAAGIVGFWARSQRLDTVGM